MAMENTNQDMNTKFITIYDNFETGESTTEMIDLNDLTDEQLFEAAPYSPAVAAFLLKKLSK